MQAKCAVHPENLAGGTCTRCGNFVCYVDTEGGRFTTCEACRGRTSDAAFPLNRQSYNFGTLWDHSWNMFKTHWLMLSLGVLVPAVVGFVMAMFMNVLNLPLMMLGGRGSGDAMGAMAIGSVVMTFAFILAFYVVLGGIAVGYFRMIQDTQEGRAPDIGRMFSQFSKIGRVVLGLILIFVATFVVTFIFGMVFGLLGAGLRHVSDTLATVVTVPLLIALYVGVFFVSLPFQFFLPEIALTEVGTMDALKNCWKIADGYRWHMVLMFLVAVPIALVGMLACCVGIIPAYALIALLFTNLHRALRNGADGIVGEPVP